jgi:cytochrome c nitrite reductase small subunit
VTGAGRQSTARPTRGASLLFVAAALFAAAVGVAVGIGGYVFVYAEGASYLTDDPAACANCHVMQAHLDAWSRASHRAVAVCNDCHAPRGFAGKYAVKAINGWNHSVAFVTGDFAEPFHVTPMNRRVTEAACRTCHGEIVAAIDHAGGGAEPIACVRCHADVGHDVQ